MRQKRSWSDLIFNIIVRTLLIILTAMCIFPFINLLAVSLSSPEAVMSGDVFFLPKGFTMEVYKSIIRNGSLVMAMWRTIILTIVYVFVCVTMTLLCAYPLSIPELKGKNFFWPFIMFTMYFSGGMIPNYILVNQLGLIDSYAALILPGMISTYNMIVMRSFLSSIPNALRESAFIDGANDLTIFLKIILPLSKPAIATIALFYAVGRWNGITDALLYINSSSMAVLQIKLKAMVNATEQVNELLEGNKSSSTMITATMRAGSILFSLIPVLIIYPFLQKYFVKGVMIGAVKG